MDILQCLKWIISVCFDSTYTKIGMIQRRLAWPLHKDDTQIREAFHIFSNVLLDSVCVKRKKKKFILSSTYSGKPLLIFLVRGVCVYVYLYVCFSCTHVCTHT